MGFFGSLFNRKEKQQTTPVSIRDTLFGDMPLNQWPRDGQASHDFPWDIFVAARQHLSAGNTNEAVALWQKILEHPNLESRFYLQAWHFLRQSGCQPTPDDSRDVLGVVVEVSLQNGLDLLAAYADHSARYYNYSGAGVVWEHPDSSLNLIIDRLLAAAKEIVALTAPWEEPRLAPPPCNCVRLSFLTPGGLHFGQGPINELSREPLGGRVFDCASELMKSLIETAKPR